MSLSFQAILSTLQRHGAEFAVVAGVAAVLHGAPVTNRPAAELTLNISIIGSMGEGWNPQCSHPAAVLRQAWRPERAG